MVVMMQVTQNVKLHVRSHNNQLRLIKTTHSPVFGLGRVRTGEGASLFWKLCGNTNWFLRQITCKASQRIPTWFWPEPLWK